MSKHPIATTHNGTLVYVNLVTSPVSAYISQQPHVLTLIKELLAHSSITGPVVSFEHDFGRAIGNSDIISITEKDTVIYAKRPMRDSYTPFVRRRLPTSSNYLSIVLHRDAKGEYELRDAWIGRLAPPLPGSTDETDQSKTYWSQHALVLEGQPIQTRTLTKVCPY